MAFHRYSTLIDVPAVTKWLAGDRVELRPATRIKVFIEIDEQGLAESLGKKAWLNKSRKAHEVGGLVRCVEVRS